MSQIGSIAESIVIDSSNMYRLFYIQASRSYHALLEIGRWPEMSKTILKFILATLVTLLIVQGVCADEVCTADDQCNMGKVCIAGACSACTADSQCGTGNMCFLGACTGRSCSDISECPYRQFCPASPGYCMIACGEPWPCPAGRVCIYTNSQGGYCGGCFADSQCTAGKVCIEGACVTAPPECTSNAECAVGQVCSSGACGACTADSQCDTGQVCQSGTCTTQGTPVPEFPSIILPAAVIIGILGAVLYIRRTREY